MKSNFYFDRYAGISTGFLEFSNSDSEPGGTLDLDSHSIHKIRLQFSTAFQGFCHRHFVGILKISADRQSQSETGHSNPQWLDQAREIECGGFAFYIGLVATITSSTKAAFESA